MLEIEAKIKLKNRETLLSRGNLHPQSLTHVLDIYYDNNGALKSVDKVLRLRKLNDKATLTVKGPKIYDANLLVREEFEIEISDFDTSKKMLYTLSFAPTQVVEKTRETFKLAGCQVKIELDQYPFIGTYLELEGEREAVFAIMEKLGFSRNEGITKNCTELFYEYIRKNNINLDNPKLQFTFEDEKNTLIPAFS